MSFYNFILEKVILPAGDQLNGSRVMRHLKSFRSISKASEKEIEDIQRQKLEQILNFSVKNVPYYTKYADKKLEDPFEWLKEFPIMYKKDINENTNELVTKPIDSLIKKGSSGSSGVHTYTYMDKNSLAICRSIQILWWEWAGWKIGDPVLQTGMVIERSALKKLKDKLFKTKYMLAFGLSQEQVKQHLLSTKFPANSFLGGYASSLYLLAKAANDNQINNVKFSGAVSWGDKLYPHFKEEIKTAFGCEIKDTYACSEGIMIAAQKDLDQYYIMTPHIHLELVNSEGNEIQDGELGYVVVTRLDAHAMPFIRYYTGDLAVKLPKEKYPSKREMNFPLLERIIGRDTDIVRTRSGEYMIVHFFTAIFQLEKDIKQFKVVQENMDGIIIEYIENDDFDSTCFERLETRIQGELQVPIKIDWKKVDEILPTKSGKPQIIESKIKKEIAKSAL